MAKSRSRSPAARRKIAARKASVSPSPPRGTRSKVSPKRAEYHSASRSSKSLTHRPSKSPLRSNEKRRSDSRDPNTSRLRSSPSKEDRPSLASRLGSKRRSRSASPVKERRVPFKTTQKRSQSPVEDERPSMASRLGSKRPTPVKTSRKRIESPEPERSKTSRQANTSSSGKRSLSPEVSTLPKKYPNIKITKSTRSKDEKMEITLEGEVENLPIFRGPELDPVSRKEFKKIQIEIRRNLPESIATTSPVRRDIDNPDKLFVPRKSGEGKAAIFEREEIKIFLPDDDKASLIKKLDPRKVVESPSRSRSPRARESRDSKRENVKEKDLRDRLEKPKISTFNRNRLEPRDTERARVSSRVQDRVRESGRIQDSGRARDSGQVQDRLRVQDRLEKPSMKSRLGDKISDDKPSSRDRTKPEYRERERSGNRSQTKSDSRTKPANRVEGDRDKPLSREELERERPQVQLWEINPEVVPKGRYYFEHDNREGEAAAMEDDRSFRGQGRTSRGGFSNRSRGRFQNRDDFRKRDDFKKRDDFQNRDGERSRDGFRGRDRNSRRPFRLSYNDSRSSPEWRHDKFTEELERHEEPTSTTNE